jgi:hypothetical protein
VLSRQTPTDASVRPPEPDPRVLTVSQKSEDGGHFRTIQAALDNVRPGMIIRVLDDAVYEEYLLINARHRGVVLEAPRKATIRKRRDGAHEAVFLSGVPDFTLRGFRLESSVLSDHTLVRIDKVSPGVVLDRLEMSANMAAACVVLYDVPLSDKDAPIVIQNCSMRRGQRGILVRARDFNLRNNPLPVRRVVIRENIVAECVEGVSMEGALQEVQAVGNCLIDCRVTGIEWGDPLHGAADVLVANNTFLRIEQAVRIWDDHGKGMEFLKCKNVRIQNNLILDPPSPDDMLFRDHIRGQPNSGRPGDLPRLLNSPEWRFSNNWREVDPAKAAARASKVWIPPRPGDRLQVPIPILSRTSDDPNFLRPPKGSPLGKAGAGTTDPALPAYVGAVPPEGVAPWDWDKTWKAMTR